MEDQRQHSAREAEDDDAPCVIGNFKHVGPTWHDFLTQHGVWFDERGSEDDIVYAFPAAHADHRLAKLFTLEERELRAEIAYATLCKDFHAIAINRNKPVKHRWMQPETLTEKALHEEMRGWISKEVRQAAELIGKTTSVTDRLRGSAGRLVCSPEFCSFRDRIKSQWQQLPGLVRPSLPLTRSVKVACPNHLSETDGKIPADVIEFTRLFDQFCDTWRLNGMTTWDLPDVDGPKWPQPTLSDAATLPGQLVFDTPFHFHLRTDDGLGELHRQEHNRLVDDELNKWQTYGQLLQIDFWETVIRRRYAQRTRVHAFAMELTKFIAAIVGLGNERIDKLRKTRNALQRGSLSSLAERR